MPPDAPPRLEPAPATGGRRHRRARNFLLDAGLQLRLASYLLAVALALSAGLGALLWEAWRETSRVVALADPEGALGPVLAAEDRQRVLLVATALAGLLACLLGAAVIVTHRIAGPAYAIRRTCQRVREGRLAVPPPLRARDLLGDLGAEVSAMVLALRQREASERDALAAAARALRAGAGAEAERAAAAAALERLAADKEGRLAS